MGIRKRKQRFADVEPVFAQIYLNNNLDNNSITSERCWKTKKKLLKGCHLKGKLSTIEIPTRNSSTIVFIWKLKDYTKADYIVCYCITYYSEYFT